MMPFNEAGRQVLHFRVQESTFHDTTSLGSSHQKSIYVSSSLAHLADLNFTRTDVCCTACDVV